MTTTNQTKDIRPNFPTPMEAQNILLEAAQSQIWEHWNQDTHRGFNKDRAQKIAMAIQVVSGRIAEIPEPWGI